MHERKMVETPAISILIFPFLPFGPLLYTKQKITQTSFVFVFFLTKLSK